MKKKVLFLAAISMVAVLLMGVLAACYPSNPASLSKIAGTYELSSYTRSNSEEKDPETEASISHNLIEEKGVVAYLVVNTDGTGYYIYKDNTHELSARMVRITYNYDDEKPSLVENIRYTYGESNSGDGGPNRGHETLGVNFKRRTKNLSYSMPAVFGRKYSQSVTYKQVSTDTTLDYVQKKLGTSFAVAPFDVAGLDGWHYYSAPYDETYPYIYYYIDLRMADRTADVYYALKADKQPHVQRNLAVTYNIPEDVTANITLTVGDKTYYANNIQFDLVPTGIWQTATEEQPELWYNRSARAGFDGQAAMAEDLRVYEEYLSYLAGNE